MRKNSKYSTKTTRKTDIMQRYDSYKPSGVKWLGEIPEHWEVKRLASYFTERRVKVSDKDFEPLSVTKLGVFPQWENVAKTNDGDNRKLVKKGDFVINSRSDRKGSSGISDRDGSVSLINIVLQSRKTILAQFSNYLLKSYRFIEEYYRNGRGIVADLWTTRYDEMKMIKLAIPPLKEQEAIADYLDTVTAKIDSAIAQQQKMIDLLNERKQIIINNAVTKGLNPNAKMKDSGVEWIGEIPEDWEVNKFKNLYKTRTGITFTKAQLVEYGEPVISYGQIHSKDNLCASVNPDLIRYIPSMLTEGNQEALAERGDFLFADTSEDFEGCGNNIYIDTDSPIYAGYHTILAKCNNNQCGPYLAYLFASTKWRGQIRSMVNGVKVYSITQSIIKNANVILPSLDEQKEIADYIKERVVVIDKAIKGYNKQISLLQERKQIVVNEVVTGKVRVG